MLCSQKTTNINNNARPSVHRPWVPVCRCSCYRYLRELRIALRMYDEGEMMEDYTHILHPEELMASMHYAYMNTDNYLYFSEYLRWNYEPEILAGLCRHLKNCQCCHHHIHGKRIQIFIKLRLECDPANSAHDSEHIIVWRKQ